MGKHVLQTLIRHRGLRRQILVSTVSSGLSLRKHEVNSRIRLKGTDDHSGIFFLIPPYHMLLVLIRSASARRF